MANSIRNLINIVTGNMSDINSTTYLNTGNYNKQQESLKKDIYKAIEDLNNRSYETTGFNSISTIYDRLFKTLKDPNLPASINDIFGDESLLNTLAMSYIENKPIYDYDREIDLVCSQMPKLQEALETKKDHVLSPDHFNKEFLKIVKDSDLSDIKDSDYSIFNKDISLMKRKYDLETFVEESYMRVSKYGEDFIYCVPYSTAIAKLLDSKKKNIGTSNNLLGTLTTKITENGDISLTMEGESITHKNLSKTETIDTNIKLDKTLQKTLSKVPKLIVELSNESFIDTLIKDSNFVNLNKKSLVSRSLVHEASLEMQNTIKDGVSGKIGDKYIGTKEASKLRPFDKTIGDSILIDKTAEDGFININNKNNDNKVSAKGCILKYVPRHRVIPIYIDNTNMGYYYFEFQETDEYSNMTNVSNMFGNKTAEIINSDKNAKAQDMLLKSLASALSEKIDSTFVNNNQDLSKEIYSILKYNDLYNIENGETKIKVAYIPPEDMFHLYFKKNDVTHRGISDLAVSLIPAKLWICLNLTYIIGNMTRGQDKRVYYVKQTVDTNIAQTLLTTIDQIKRSNFNIRQIENINNILNIIGRFNDYVIPRSQSGDSPVEFEIMPGQNIEPPTEIMDKLEESAINATDVPIDVINARMSMDFAIHYTMNNTRFLRKVIKRQGVCEDSRMYSGLLTRIYNLEYSTNDILKLVLPMPLFLDVSNTSQILQNVNDLCNNIAEAYLSDEQDENVKNIFIKKIKLDYLSTYINIDKLNKYLEDSKIELKLKEYSDKASNSNSDSEY